MAQELPPAEEIELDENGDLASPNAIKTARHVFPAEPIAISGVVGNTHVEIALQYNNGEQETILGFANTYPTPERGTHITGFLRALTKVINGLKPTRTKYDGKTIRRGLTAVVSVMLPNPMWYGSSRDRLMNCELEGVVFSIVYAGLKRYFQDNPEIAGGMGERFADG